MDSMGGKHVVVTGGGRGIGRAIAERLAAEGAGLTLLARDLEALQQVAASSAPPPPRATSATAPRSTRRSPPRQPSAARSMRSSPTAGSAARTTDGPDDRFDDLVATNLSGTYYCMRAALRHLAPGPERRAFRRASRRSSRGSPVAGYTGYSASKAGLLGLVRSLAAELGPQNVQVNAICPGWVNTDMAWSGLDGIAEATGGTRDDAYRDAMKEVPLGRMGEPADVAGTVAWLLSEDARGVTGQAIDQNGGAWMGLKGSAPGGRPLQGRC